MAKTTELNETVTDLNVSAVCREKKNIKPTCLGERNVSEEMDYISQKRSKSKQSEGRAGMLTKKTDSE